MHSYSRIVTIALTGFCLLWIGLLAGALHRRSESVEGLEAALPRRSIGEEFVSSDACRPCHPREYATWHASYHRTMTQPVGPATVVGDFGGVRLERSGRVFDLESSGEEFWVRSGNDRRRVVMTTGLHHYQVYWLQAKDGNWLEDFPFVYLRDERRWFPRADVFLAPASSAIEEPRVWNAACIECHSTFGQPRISDDGKRMDTRVAELGIACEACHGPGAAHVRLHRDPAHRYRAHLAKEPDHTMVNPSRTKPRVASEICGQCHAIFAGLEYEKPGAPKEEYHRRGSPYRAGGDLEKGRILARHPARGPMAGPQGFLRSHRMETDGYFWKDGMVRVSGREYNGLVESPCYQRGDLSCLSCHSMHGGDPDDQLKPDLSGDESCLQCHERQRARPEEHTHHLRGSSGSRCLNCHMPHTTYGLLKAIRSHEIDSPRVAAATLSSGRPNACNLCHLDRTLAWTAGYLAEWYRLPATPLPPEHQTVSAALLHLLKGDAGQRAIIAWHLGWEDALGASGRDWQGPFLGLLLDDPYSAVRSIAYRSLRRLEGYREFAYDPIGSPEERREARRRSLRSWPGARPSEWRRGSQLLLKDDETVDLDAVEALLRGRDDGPVDLKE